jgi:hypothetical protein
MTQRFRTICIGLATLLFWGCETTGSYGLLNRAFLSIYKFSPRQERTAETQVRRMPFQAEEQEQTTLEIDVEELSPL